MTKSEAVERADIYIRLILEHQKMELDVVRDYKVIADGIAKIRASLIEELQKQEA